MAMSVFLPFVHLDELGVTREDGPRKDVTKQTKRIKSATGPTQDKTKTKKLVEFGYVGGASDDSDVELSGKNEDTSHADVAST
jgi:hypothetical protein